VAARVVSRTNQIIAPYFAKLRAAGKPASCPCMRELVVILNAILRSPGR
jgi:hypothetical protein